MIPRAMYTTKALAKMKIHPDMCIRKAKSFNQLFIANQDNGKEIKAANIMNSSNSLDHKAIVATMDAPRSFLMAISLVRFGTATTT